MYGGSSHKPRRRLLDHAELMQVGVGAEAVAMSKDLRRRGWAFVGPTTVNSFMQAMGLTNDHARGCEAGAAAQRRRRDFERPS